MIDERSAAHEQATLEVLALFRRRGHSRYGGEAVSQQEHALQAASFAEEAGANADLIVAALLHDVGHLLHTLADDAPEQGLDDRHEDLGARWLQKRFAPAVVDPVALHVAAKRYLCAADAGYLERLSPPSVLSLTLQGGPMSLEEQRGFEAHPCCQAAIALRRWDDAAKVPHLATPPLEHFLRYLDQSLWTARTCGEPGVTHRERS